MNRTTVRLSLALAAALVASTSRAQVSDDIVVTATVKKNCTVTAGDISFGDYDPVDVNATAAVDTTADVVVACTKNVAYDVALDTGDNGARRMTDGTDFLSYELYSDSTRTTVWDAANVVKGTGQGKTTAAHTVYARLPGGQDDAAPGLYTDTVTATVIF